MKAVFEKVIPPKTGLAVEVKTGQIFRVTDLEGKQVVDMAVFNLANLREKLSTSYSRTRYVPEPGQPYIPRDKLVAGDTLMSTICLGRSTLSFIRSISVVPPATKRTSAACCAVDDVAPN